MKTAKRLLLLDVNQARRTRLKETIERIGNLVIDSRSSIDRESYEDARFDVAIVHYGNQEGPLIECGWSSKGTRVLIFSGGFSKPKDEFDGIVYTSARFLEQGDNLVHMLESLVQG